MEKEMKVEIIEFYPVDRKQNEFILGTLRVRLPDIGISILGIIVSRKGNYWHFQMPGRKSMHHETGDMVRFPFICFDDRERQKALIEAIRKSAPEFIEQRLEKIEKP